MPASASDFLPLWAYAVFFVTGLFAGFIDAMAGGGGIISLPVLLNFDMPVAMALGTNKLQATFGSITASLRYVRGGAVQWERCYAGIAATLVGAAIGTFAVAHVSNKLLEKAIPWFLVAIATYTIVRPAMGRSDHPPRWPETPYFLVAGLALGFYDGLFGPGTGSFWTMALVAGLGFNFTKATGYTKVMNATSNIVSLAIFAAAGKVAYLPGVAMGFGQLLGAHLGSHLVLRNGAKLVRPLFILMVLATVGRLLYLNFVAATP